MIAAVKPESPGKPLLAALHMLPNILDIEPYGLNFLMH